MEGRRELLLLLLLLRREADPMVFDTEAVGAPIEVALVGVVVVFLIGVVDVLLLLLILFVEG